jgi:23S rRNA (adenine2503-C2)-methyltransferase
MEKMRLCGLTADEIFNIIEPAGFERRHAISIANAVYKKRITAISEIAKIPKSLVRFLEETCFIGFYNPHSSLISADKTEKYLFNSKDGKYYETVYIPDNKRNTVCVSTQSGCRMGCPFCITGSYGFHGNLTAGDILNQVLSIPRSSEVNHVVFMGMGEPMDNLENVLKACRILTAEWGLAIGSGNVTVSTVGIAEGVRTFLENSGCNLTVSLYSPFPEERAGVVPAEKIYPVRDIIEIMRNYSKNKRRRLSAAYVMISNNNDSDSHLEGLKKMLGGTGIRVNLLPYHKAENDVNSSSSMERMQFFRHELIISGISASVRRSRGADISAACGLLASGLKQK